MFARVIIATDLSEASDQIVVNLSGLSALGTRDIILAHAMDVPPQSISTPGFDYAEALGGDLSRRTQARLAKQRDVVGAQGFEATARIIYGPPATAIDGLAHASHASLVIAGSRGASLAKNVVLGGRAMDILQHSRVPVLLKRLAVNAPGATNHYRLLCRDFSKHLLYATDFSINAERAFSFLENLVRRCGSEVTLLHVLAGDENNPSGSAEESLSEKAAALTAAGARKVSVEIRRGDAAGEITATAQERNISLLVLGTQGREHLDEFSPGHTCRDLAANAAVPMLTIPPKAVASTIGAHPAAVTSQKEVSDL